ncbi:MAG: hypothetical protein JNL54_15290 [Kineosporiaceae bacterium]|nr:hypothetical protein [Kineosporiaceae bacterium]
MTDTTHYLTEQRRATPERRWAGRIRDAHFGYPTIAELTQFHVELGAAVREQILRGAPVHRRLPLPMRHVPWVVALLDVVVLLSFTADVFNVATGALLEAPLRSTAALMLALLGGGVGYTWLAMTGLRLRSFRTELGEISWRTVGSLTWIMLAVSGVLVAALALLMDLRVVNEIRAMGMDGAVTAATLGAIFAVLSAIANLAVIAVHALDGSWAMAELERAGARLHWYDQLAAGRGPQAFGADGLGERPTHRESPVGPVPPAA